MMHPYKFGRGWLKSRKEGVYGVSQLRFSGATVLLFSKLARNKWSLIRAWCILILRFAFRPSLLIYMILLLTLLTYCTRGPKTTWVVPIKHSIISTPFCPPPPASLYPNTTSNPFNSKNHPQPSAGSRNRMVLKLLLIHRGDYETIHNGNERHWVT